MMEKTLENKAICSLCDRIFDPNLFIVNTIILLGPNSGLSNRNEFVICRECYKNAVEELVDYPENRRYKMKIDKIQCDICGKIVDYNDKKMVDMFSNKLLSRDLYTDGGFMKGLKPIEL